MSHDPMNAPDSARRTTNQTPPRITSHMPSNRRVNKREIALSLKA